MGGEVGGTGRNPPGPQRLVLVSEESPDGGGRKAERRLESSCRRTTLGKPPVEGEVFFQIWGRPPEAPVRLDRSVVGRSKDQCEGRRSGRLSGLSVGRLRVAVVERGGTTPVESPEEDPNRGRTRAPSGEETEVRGYYRGRHAVGRASGVPSQSGRRRGPPVPDRAPPVRLVVICLDYTNPHCHRGGVPCVSISLNGTPRVVAHLVAPDRLRSNSGGRNGSTARDPGGSRSGGRETRSEDKSVDEARDGDRRGECRSQNTGPARPGIGEVSA